MNDKERWERKDGRWRFLKGEKQEQLGGNYATMIKFFINI